VISTADRSSSPCTALFQVSLPSPFGAPFLNRRHRAPLRAPHHPFFWSKNMSVSLPMVFPQKEAA
jgi:hypothetical protein